MESIHTDTQILLTSKHSYFPTMDVQDPSVWLARPGGRQGPLLGKNLSF